MNNILVSVDLILQVGPLQFSKHYSTGRYWTPERLQMYSSIQNDVQTIPNKIILKSYRILNGLIYLSDSFN